MRNADETRVSSPSRPLWVSLAKITAVMVVLTIPFWVSGLDMAFQTLFFKGGWFLEANPIIRFLYRWGTLPGVLLACSALLLLIRGGNRDGRRGEWRRAAAALLITFFLGPGLMINGISKKYTGRPRPREITAFGGNHQYHNVFELGVPGRGHSFPAGHPSTGFMLFSLYYSLRSRRRRQARAWWGAGMVYGCVMGLGRIIQGAHFLSDVLWSGGMTLAAARIAHWWTGGDSAAGFVRKEYSIQGRTTRSVAGLLLVVLLVLGILAGTPFNSQSTASTAHMQRLVLDVEDGNVVISRKGLVPAVAVKARGFAPPFSRYRADWGFFGPQAVLRMRRRGFFFELNVDIQVNLPREFNGDLLVRSKNGDVEIQGLPTSGRVLVETAKGSIRIAAPGGNNKNGSPGDPVASDLPGPMAIVLEAPEGAVILPRYLQDRGRLFPMPGDVVGSCFGWETEWGRVFVTALAIRFDGRRRKLQ